MKKVLYILMVSVVCACLAGCTDDSYRGQYDLFNSGYTTSQIPVWIKIGETTDITRSATKGNGVVESAKDLTEDFHIYAFNKDNTTSYRTTADEDALNTLLDGSIDDAGTLAGRAAEWDELYGRVVWKDGKDVYWPMSSSRDYRYDFFAYYLDDMPLTAENYHRTDDEINIDIEIDGMQDIMSSKAVPSDMKLDAMFPDEMDKAMYKHYYCYSHKSAMMNLQPEFVFEHHLSKIRFKVVPGVTEGKVNKVTIHSVSVDSKYKGTFRVASRDRQQGIRFDSQSVRTFDLMTDETGPLVVETLNSGSQTPAEQDVDGYLLLAPSSQGYWIHMDMSEVRNVGTPEEEELSRITYTTFIYRGLKESPDPFEPGDEYTVTLHVFGRADVRVNVEMKPWENGGYVIPETEDIPG